MVVLMAALFVSLTPFAQAGTNSSGNEIKGSQDPFNRQKEYAIINRADESILSLPFTFGYFVYSVVFTPNKAEGSTFTLSTEFPLLKRNNFRNWKFVDLGGDVVQIVNIESGNAIDVANATAVPVQAKANSSDKGQQWKVVDSGSFKSFVSVLTGKALAKNGEKLVQRIVRSNNAAQQWKVMDETDPLAPIIIAPNPVSTTANIFLTLGITSNNVEVRIEEIVPNGGGVVVRSSLVTSVRAGETKEVSLDASGLSADPSRYYRTYVYVDGRPAFFGPRLLVAQ